VLVPPFVSMYNTFGRIASAQRAGGLVDTASPGLGLLLFIVALVFLPGELVSGQIELNKLWQRERVARAG
jgi:hypothetical protein